MHLARIEHTDDEEAYDVSFVKLNPDGSYCWPDPEDKSSVDRCDMVNLKPPAEDIISGAGSVVRVKLIFWQRRFGDSQKDAQCSIEEPEMKQQLLTVCYWHKQYLLPLTCNGFDENELLQ